MSTKYISSNWRLPNQENSSKSDNYGLTFDGSSQDISFTTPSPFNGTTLNNFDCSFVVWAKFDSIIQFGALVCFGTFDLEIAPVTTTEVGIWVNNSYISGVLHTPSLNVWYNYVMTKSGNTYSLYVDGTLVGSGVDSDNATVGSTTFIGSNGGSPSRSYHDGQISEASIFDYALSATQISTLYGSSELGSTSPMTLKPQPVAFYPLGDNSASNPLTQPNEAVEDASVFDFVPNDDINCGTNSIFDITENITLSGWINRDDNLNLSTIITKWNSGPTDTAYILRVGSSGGAASNSQIQMLIRNTSGVSVTATEVVGEVCINKWVHIMGTYNGSTIRLFYNGVELGSGTAQTGNIETSTAPLRIGSRGSEYIDGKMSNIVIWNSDQSSEISNIYNSGVPATTYTNTPTAWYKLDQSANWDVSSSGNWQIPDAVSAYPQSFDFDGSTPDLINCGNSTDFDFATQITISAWVKTTDQDSINNIVKKDDGASNRGWNLSWRGSSGGGSRLVFWNWSTDGTYNYLYTTGTPASNFADGNWHHVVATYDGTADANGAKIYLDGVLMSQGAVSRAGTGLKITTEPVEIGDGISGNISNIQLFNSSLPETGTDSVETLYNNGVPLTTAIASDNLKAWYKLDNTATFSTNWSIPDASGNGNTGTSSGMTEQNLVNNNVSALNGESSGMTSANLVLSDLTRAVPYDSYSFELDGANDYIDFGDSDTFSFGNGTADEAFSVSGWIYADSNSRFKIIAKMDATDFEYQFGTNSSGKLSFTLYSLNTANRIQRSYNTAITTSVWQHWVATYDGSALVSGLKIYINGVRVDDTTSTSGTYTAMQNTTSTLKIGTSDLSNYANGKVSNVSIFNNELTSTEVMKLYSNGVPQDLTNFTPAPVAWYTLGSNSFWNGSQWTVRDMIGSNDGTGQNIGIDGLVGDAPRSEANGTGTNMDVPTNLEGSTKWSENNSWSINMSETARVEDTP